MLARRYVSYLLQENRLATLHSNPGHALHLRRMKLR
jgi:hypothetical protein